MSKAVFVFGEICSGKSTFLNKEPNSTFIELGQLVRDLYKTEERIYDATLDDYLASKVEEIVKNSKNEMIFILGCRQVSLLKKLTELFENFEYNYLQVPRKILKDRFKKRASKKDQNISFEEVIERDVELGIDELKLYLINEAECNFIKNY